MTANLTVVSAIAFLAGVVTALAVVAVLLARSGPWVPIDAPECEADDDPGGCYGPHRRHGWVDVDRVRWRLWFRCPSCDCRWLRRWVWALVPVAVLEGMRQREAEDRGVAP